MTLLQSQSGTVIEFFSTVNTITFGNVYLPASPLTGTNFTLKASGGFSEFDFGDMSDIFYGEYSGSTPIHVYKNTSFDIYIIMVVLG